MRKHISSKLNRIAHHISNSTGLPWGESFRLGIRLLDIPMKDLLMPTSIVGIWQTDSLKALAGHYWGLSKAYAEIQDFGRSYTMRLAAKTLYDYAETKKLCSLKVLIQTRGLAESTLKEAIDFFVASQTLDLTPRSETLIIKGAQRYGELVKAPLWRF